MSLRLFQCKWHHQPAIQNNSSFHRGVQLSIPQDAGPALKIQVAPLAGFHAETCEDVFDFCASFSPSPAKDAATLAGVFEGVASLPSLSWAIGSASFVSENRSLQSAILIAHPQQSLSESKKGAVLKIKVGRDVEQELQLIEKLCEQAFPPRLRLDGNQLCTPKDALCLAQKAQPYLDFFEEPGRDALLILAAQGIPIALDETLIEISKYDLWHLAKPNLSACVWVLKPSLLGWHGTQVMLQKAKLFSAQVVISATYEVSDTAHRLAAFASMVNPAQTHGLGTSAFLGPVEWDCP